MPTLDASWFRDLCPIWAHVDNMTAALRRWLTGHFGSVENLANQDPRRPVRRMIWDEDPTRTGIVIEDADRWRPQVTEFRPAVVLQRGEWKQQRLGMGSCLTGGTNVSGPAHYEEKWHGSHSVVCVAYDSGEVKDLATEVWHELREFSPVFRSLLDLHSFAVAGLAPCVILEEARDAYAVPIFVTYSFVCAWRLAAVGPPLERASIAIA